MTYTMPFYIPLAAAVLGLALAAVGVFLIKRRQRIKMALRLAFVCFLMALFFGGYMAPGMYLDRVTLNEQRLERPHWVWFMPGHAPQGFDLARTRSIEISVRERTARRGRRISDEVWTATYDDGSTEEVVAGDIWKYYGWDIAQRLRQRGIAIKDLR
ncbi:MAG: hypothetical protein ACREP7_08395 [Lysobacter sp.]